MYTHYTGSENPEYKPILFSEGLKMLTCRTCFHGSLVTYTEKDHQLYLTNKERAKESSILCFFIDNLIEIGKKRFTKGTSVFPHSSGGSWWMAI